jgi:ryanodine receptor 2
MGTELQDLYVDNVEMGNSMKSLQFESVRPQMLTSEISSSVEDIKTLSTPYFPLEVVRDVVMEALDQATKVNQVHNRDPIGGSNEDLFV